ncbi:MAG TPA: hypothetical protein VET88_02795 [Gammaproteobacteria bacterium]|nr:hypothetical protein [Gammaproteobacteria bacterium]
MNTDISGLLEEMRGIQEQLERRFDSARETFRYSVENGRVLISREVRELQRRYLTGSLRYLLDASLTSVLTAPVVYSMLLPLLIVDLGFSLYQQVCFRAYGVPRVVRRRYRVNDRHRLAYLNTIEKINCAYCGYANGVMAYAREIISRTEQHWCPIRHARHVPDAHKRYPRFFPYGDAVSWHEKLAEKRQELAGEAAAELQEPSPS